MSESNQPTTKEQVFEHIDRKSSLEFESDPDDQDEYEDWCEEQVRDPTIKSC